MGKVWCPLSRDYCDAGHGGECELWNDRVGSGACKLSLIASSLYKIARAVADGGGGGSSRSNYSSGGSGDSSGGGYSAPSNTASAGGSSDDDIPF